LFRTSEAKIKNTLKRIYSAVIWPQVTTKNVEIVKNRRSKK